MSLWRRLLAWALGWLQARVAGLPPPVAVPVANPPVHTKPVDAHDGGDKPPSSAPPTELPGVVDLDAVAGTPNVTLKPRGS